MIENTAQPVFTPQSTATADQAESFLRDLRRLEGYWEEGVLSTEELQEAVAKLRRTEFVPEFLLWESPDIDVPLD